MQLVLTVENAPNQNQVGSSYQFGHMGGSIGRSASNDWTLVDQDRFISEHHASVSFDDGHFMLTDLSTNGTFLNQAKQRLPRNSITALSTGDRLLIGNLRISVLVRGERRSPISRDSEDDRRGVRHDDMAEHGRPVVRRHESPIIPSEWTALLGAEPAPEAVRSSCMDSFTRNDDEASAADGSTRLRINDPARQAHRGSADTAVAALVDGLGLRGLHDDTDPANFSRECGSSLRVLTDGLMRALQARAQVRERLDLDQTRSRSKGNNPLKFAPNVDVALAHMFLDSRDGSYTPGTPAFQEALDDLRIHEVAILTAVHAIVETLIDSFDPGPLEAELRKLAPMSAATPVLGDAKCWSLYRDHFVEVAAKLRDDARRGFLQEFARAYHAETKKLRDDDA